MRKPASLMRRAGSRYGAGLFSRMPYQTAILEAWLGQRLVLRSGRRTVATPLARAFAAEVRLSFDRIARLMADVTSASPNLPARTPG